MKFLTAVFLGFATLAEASPMDDALIAFATDLSGNDPAVLSAVSKLISHPPTTIEEIGFYGMENASADERKLRGIIFRLTESGYITDFEDKYINEMPILLQESGMIAATDDLDAMINQVIATYETGGSDADRSHIMQTAFPAHVAAIDAAASDAGRALLYIDVPLGDTFHLASVRPEIAAKWQDVLLLDNGKRFAVTAPQWDIYYDFLGYAILAAKAGPVPFPRYDPSRLRSLADIGFGE